MLQKLVVYITNQTKVSHDLEDVFIKISFELH